MALFRDRPGELNYVSRIDRRGARVGENTHELPIIVSPSAIMPAARAGSDGTLDPETLHAIFELEPEVVIVGSGSQQHFLTPETMMEFHRRGVGIEVMKTEAACRTFNILVVEAREVVALLMPIE